MRSSKKRWRWAVLMLVIAGATAIVITIRTREPSLLERAIKIYTYRMDSGSGECYWLSDHEFVGERLNYGKWTMFNYDISARSETAPEYAKAAFVGHEMRKNGMYSEMRRENTIVKQFTLQNGETLLPFAKSFVKLPRNSRAVEYDRAHHLRRIAWLMTVERIPAWMSTLHRIVPAYRIPAKTTRLEVWISHSDGSHMRRLGWLEYPETQRGGELQWLPGDRQLSFIYNDGIYTVQSGE